MNLFEYIRRLTSDSRMISLNTDTPQYKVGQLKSKLFLTPQKQSEETCKWWLRLYKGQSTKEDVRLLKNELSKID